MRRRGDAIAVRILPRAGVPVAALALLLAAAEARALPDETWLVAIGNNRGDADEVALLYAERDARQIVETLRQHGGLSGQRVTLLVDEDAGSVRRAVVDLNVAIRSRAEHGVRSTGLVVYYSGHADAQALHLRGTHLPFDELRALVQGSPAGLRLLVVDACRSGNVTQVKGVAPAESFKIDLVDQVEAEGVAIITSSSAGESSQESDRLRGSFFTHHLVNALRGAADRNSDGRVTLAEAYSYAYAQTLRSSGRTMTLQHPTYSFDVKGRGDLVLAQHGGTAGRSGQVRLAEAGLYLVAEKHEGGDVVAEIAPPHDRASLDLPASAYFVQRRGASEFREYQFELREGQEVDLTSLPYRSVRYDRLVRARGGERAYVHGLTIVAGVRGEVMDGEGVTPQLVLGYGLDLPWFTPGVRVRGATVRSAAVDGHAPRRHSELGIGLSLQRFVDLSWFSLAFGVVTEAVLHVQRFDTDRTAKDRTSFGGSFGGLFSLERHVHEGLAVRVEGGPVTALFPQGVVTRGREAGSAVTARFTWWAGGGLLWRL